MPFSIKQNDRRPLFVVVLKDDFGEPTEAVVDLTDALSHSGTTAVFNMRQSGGTAIAVNRGSAVITAPGTAGEVTYAWQAADTSTAGTYEAEIEILWSDGKAETFPSDSYWAVEITDDIA